MQPIYSLYLAALSSIHIVVISINLKGGLLQTYTTKKKHVN